MTETTNYLLKLYATTDVPNLITGYNASMTIIDTQLKANSDAAAAADTKATNAASTAATADGKAVAAQNTANTNATAISGLNTRVSALETGSFAPSANDSNFTVSNLSGAKVTSNGIVYVPQS